MRRPHENVATVLVDPAVLSDVSADLASEDLWVWPIATAPVHVDGARAAFQVRRRMVEARRGAWDEAATWTPVWVAFGDSWHTGGEPLPWAAHATLWETLEAHGLHVRYRKRLEGVPPLPVVREPAVRRLPGA